ncbi:nuclear transport factor 2 family protein [Virgisporangium ochraceum]|nr:nuclear transport factor 2 family protein [Virgisporangium ochraceum]
MTIAIEDRLAIVELIARHGHLVDNGGLHRSDELFDADAVFDLTDFGAGEVHGLEALYELARQLGDANPVGHHVTNTVLSELPGGEVLAQSKGIGVNADGTCGSVTYEDRLARRADGWRISHRRIRARRRPGVM